MLKDNQNLSLENILNIEDAEQTKTKELDIDIDEEILANMEVIEDDDDDEDENYELGEDLEILEETQMEDLTLTEIKLKEMDESNNQAYKTSMMLNIDPHTGGTSKGIVVDLVKHDKHEEVKTNEEDVKLESLTESEVKDIQANLIKIMMYKHTREFDDRIDTITNRIREINTLGFTLEKDVLTSQSLLKRINLSKEELERKQDFIEKVDKILSMPKPPYTHEELAILRKKYNSYDKKQIRDNLNQLRIHERKYRNQLRELEKTNEKYKSMENELYRELLTLREKREEYGVEKIIENISGITKNMTKVVACEYPSHEYFIYAKELIVCIKCSCGHKDLYEYDKLPYYKSGDIYKDFKKRRSIDRTKQNKFSRANRVIEQKGTRVQLEKEENIIERRIEIPGVTVLEENNKKVEPLVCKGCNSMMFFSPILLTSLAERGFEHDHYVLEASEWGGFENIDIEQMSKIYASAVDLPHGVNTDLKLVEYVKDTVSADKDERDKYIKKQQLGKEVTIDKRVLQDFVGDNVEIKDYRAIQNEINNLIKNSNAILTELQKTYQLKPIRDNTPKHRATIIRQENVKRKAFIDFINNNKGNIFKYVVDNKYTSEVLRRLLVNQYDKLDQLDKKLSEFLIDDVIRTTVEQRPTIYFSGVTMYTISTIDKPMPHSKFFDCYKTLIRNFLLKNNELKNRRLFKKLNELNQIKEYKEQLINSEKIVIELRELLGEEYIYSRADLFKQYIHNPMKLESNFDENHKCLPWFYEEMKQISKTVEGVKINNLEPMNIYYSIEEYLS